MKKLKIDLIKEYLLPHEILVALRWVGMNLSKAGTQEKGFIPINDLILSTCTMHYGTLTHFLNTTIVSKSNASQANNLRTKIMTDKEINQDIYSLSEVETALEFLQANHDIEMEVIGKGEDASSKVVKLTSGGMNTLADKSFLKVYLKERHDERTYKSVIWTNRMMIFFTAILAVSAAIEVYKYFIACGR